MVTPFFTTTFAPKKTLSFMIIGRGGDVRESSKWASPSMINVFAPQRTLFPNSIREKHQMVVPLNPQSLPIIKEQLEEGTAGVAENMHR